MQAGFEQVNRSAIMFVLCSLLSRTYYAHFGAGITCAALPLSIEIRQETSDEYCKVAISLSRV